MKHLQKISILILSIIGFSSCSRTYTSATSIVPTSQAPISHKAKGDLSVKASMQLHDAKDQTNFINFYHFLPVAGFDFDFSGAITDNMSVGLGYQANWQDPYVGHTISPSFNYSKNFDSKRNSIYGFDILTGIDITLGKNYMEVDEYFHNLYVTDDDYIFYDLDFNELGYYKIDEGAIRVYVQPSFTVENDAVEFHIATSFGFRNNFKYDPQLEITFNAFEEDETEFNPMVYYQNNKSFFNGETFIGLGVGPEFCRVITYAGFGYGSDNLQSNYWFGNVGIRSNFSALKKRNE